MLDKIFLSILNMSFTGSIVILFVIIARILMKKLPKIFSYLLWSVVLFRLVCPFSIESVLSLLPINTSPLPADIAYQSTPRIDTGIPILNDVVNPVLPKTEIYNSVNTIQILGIIFEFVWIFGIIALVIYSIVSLVRVKIRLSDSIRFENGNNKNKNIYCYCSSKIDTPFVIGFIMPKIYLPTNLSETEKEYIILHEQMHIRRFDHIIKLISFWVLCLHWFNPLVWVSFFLLGKDMEMSCDEAVIKNLGNNIKADYSASLLSLATGRRIINGSPLAFGEGDTKVRIKNILNYKKPSFWIAMLSVAVIIALSVGLLLNPTERSTMKWARQLKVQDVQKVELVTMPSSPHEQYKRFDESEYNDIVTLINNSRGRYIENPKSLEGASYNLYITLKNGLQHRVINNGNFYLHIDGDSYKPSYNWISSAWQYTKGNSSTPDYFIQGLYQELTIDKLKEIAKKGENISFDDFSQFYGEDVGSGLYIKSIKVSGGYTLLLGAGSTYDELAYAKLVNGENSIDIRYSDIDTFISTPYLSFWVKPDESFQVIGTTAANIWLNSFNNENTPISKRISDYKINKVDVSPISTDTSRLIEDIDCDYFAQVYYDITSKNDDFVSDDDEIKGKGTFTELYRELYIKYYPENGGMYKIVHISTGKK